MEPQATATAWANPEEPRPAPGVAYAGIGPRLGALIVDAVVYWLLMIGPYLLLETAAGMGRQSSGSYVLVLGSAFAYFTLLWAFNGGQTVGMRAAGIRVVRRKDGAPIGLGRAAVRSIGLFITLSFWFISLLAVLVGRERRSPADALAGTVVIKKDKEASAAT